LGFNDTLNDLKTTLEGNAALLSFCNSRFTKNHTVKRVFKKRTEIALDELPIILITRPTVKPGEWRPSERDYTHTVPLYCGFQCDDRELGQELLIEFEEILDAAVLVYKEPNRLPQGITDIDPRDTINDEGYFHPVYFFVKDVEISETRQL
jgi:hypothetical protein